MPPYCLICNEGMPLVIFTKCQHVCACVKCLDMEGIDVCPFCNIKSVGKDLEYKDPPPEDYAAPGFTHQSFLAVECGYVPVTTPDGRRYVAQGCGTIYIYQDIDGKRNQVSYESEEYKTIYDMYTGINTFVPDYQEIKIKKQ